jgi:sn-glycerol 3-phosphate transport system permease protein
MTSIGKPRSRKDLGVSLLYMAPAIILFTLFTFLPFIRATFLSFFIVDRNTFAPAKFFGLGYYARIFNLGSTALGDEYLRSIGTSFSFALMTVPASIVAALALAVLACVKVKYIETFRTIFTTSVAISIASAGVIWALIFSPDVKVTAWILELLRIRSSSLLTDASTALPALAFMTVWTGLGFNFIIMLAGIQAIPRELYESGRIDGANGWKTFRHITLPLLSPTLLFLTIISTISCFLAFTQFKVMIDSVGPNKSTEVFVYAIFNTFWMENNYGFASAMSIVLFAVLLVLSMLQFRFDKKVHYQ